MASDAPTTEALPPITTPVRAVSALIEWGPVARVGEGGVERWVIHPVIFWVIALGVGLLTSDERPALGIGSDAPRAEPVLSSSALMGDHDEAP